MHINVCCSTPLAYIYRNVPSKCTQYQTRLKSFVETSKLTQRCVSPYKLECPALQFYGMLNTYSEKTPTLQVIFEYACN
jgi:hypothetical protein